ncbi:hypothetical protein V1292_003357 [Bradyrhizobium sp. AZCC 1719]
MFWSDTGTGRAEVFIKPGPAMSVKHLTNDGIESAIL